MATCQAAKTVRRAMRRRRRFTEAEKRLISRGRKLLNQMELQRWLTTRCSEDLGDEADTAREVSETELSFSVAEIRSSEVAEIEDALRRIVDGTYGVCDMCGEPIPAARLRAAPSARLCLSCQKKSESEMDTAEDSELWSHIEKGPVEECVASQLLRVLRESGA
jgi:DnaK suppressor protein